MSTFLTSQNWLSGLFSPQALPSNISAPTALRNYIEKDTWTRNDSKEAGITPSPWPVKWLIKGEMNNVVFLLTEIQGLLTYHWTGRHLGNWRDCMKDLCKN